MLLYSKPLRKHASSRYFQDKNVKWEIDFVLYLQNYKNAWDGGEWVEKYEFGECDEEPAYAPVSSDPLKPSAVRETKSLQMRKGYDEKFTGHFWGYGDQVTANNFTCVSYQGMTSLMEHLLAKLRNFRYFKITKQVLRSRLSILIAFKKHFD